LYQIENEKRQAWAQARKAGQTFREFEIQWTDALAKRNIFGDIAAMAKQGGAGTGKTSTGVPWRVLP